MNEQIFIHSFIYFYLLNLFFTYLSIGIPEGRFLNFLTGGRCPRGLRTYASATGQ